MTRAFVLVWLYWFCLLSFCFVFNQMSYTHESLLVFLEYDWQVFLKTFYNGTNTFPDSECSHSRKTFILFQSYII